MKTVVTFLAGAAFGAGMVLGVMQDAGGKRMFLPVTVAAVTPAASAAVTTPQRAEKSERQRRIESATVTPGVTAPAAAPVTETVSVPMANTTTVPLTDEQLVIPVVGVSPSQLKRDFDDARGGRVQIGRAHV